MESRCLSKWNRRVFSKYLYLISCVVVIFLILVMLSSQGLYLQANAAEAQSPISSLIIPDGVYAFKNKASGFYIDIKNDSRKKGAFIQQYNYGHVPNGENERSGLYRVERIGTTEYYVIRTLRDSTNCIEAYSTGTVQTQGVSSSPTGISQTNYKWKISYHTDGYYYLCPYRSDGTNKVIGVRNTTSSGSSGGGLSLLQVVSQSSDDKNLWALYPYTGPDFKGCDLEWRGSHIVNPGQSISLSPSYMLWSYFYSTVVGEYSPGSITGYTLVNPSGSTAPVSIATISNGRVSGVSGKTGMVAVKPTYSTGTVASHYPLLYIAPDSGEYFYLSYLDPSIGETHYLTNVGMSVRRASFNSDPSQIWQIIRVSDDQNAPVLIKNVSTGGYLTSTSSSVNAGIYVQTLIQSDTYDPKQLWYWQNNNRTFRLQSVYQASIHYSLGLTLQSAENSLVIQTMSSTFLDTVPIGNDVVFLGIWEADRDRCSSYHETACFLLDYYDSFSYQFYVGTNTGSVLNLIKNSKICVTRSHGSDSSISLNQVQNIKLTKNHINSFAQNNSFNNVDIVAFIGCNTANGTDTITHAAYNAGATVAIGTTRSVSVRSANEWVAYFFACMGIGMEVEVAVIETNNYIAQVFGTTVPDTFCQCQYVGDGTFTLP